jgi:hypothetical protein
MIELREKFDESLCQWPSLLNTSRVGHRLAATGLSLREKHLDIRKSAENL